MSWSNKNKSCMRVDKREFHTLKLSRSEKWVLLCSAPRIHLHQYNHIWSLGRQKYQTRPLSSPSWNINPWGFLSPLLARHRQPQDLQKQRNEDFILCRMHHDQTRAPQNTFVTQGKMLQGRARALLGSSIWLCVTNSRTYNALLMYGTPDKLTHECFSNLVMQLKICNPRFLMTHLALLLQLHIFPSKIILEH